MRLRVFAAAALIVLAGCSTPEKEAELASAHDQQCTSYGFTPGTDGYAQCRLTLAQERAAGNERKRLAVAAALGNMSDYYNQQAANQAANRPRYTNCTTGYGGAISCTSY